MTPRSIHLISRRATVAGSSRVPLPGARLLGPSDPTEVIEVSIKLRRKRKLPSLKARPANVISHKHFEARYGASAADIKNTLDVFARFGLKKVSAIAATRTVRLRGTAAQLEKAFKTKLFNYAFADGSYRGRVGPLHVPRSIKSAVEGVFGLDNRQIARRRRQPTRNKVSTVNAAGPAMWYRPAQLAEHYNFPSGDGDGQTIALLEFGGGYFPRDLAKFCAMAGIRKPKVAAVSVDRVSTRARDGSEGEVMLDIEVVAGVCPRASIRVYFAEWTEQGWITALDTAIHDKRHSPTVISISWGDAEDAGIWTNQAMTQINESLKEAAYLGMTVCVAAGDDGSSDAISDGRAHVDFPGSSPFVLSVGGTTIISNGSAKSDIGWRTGSGLRASNGGSSGGGVSAMQRRPPWQKAIQIRSVNAHAFVGRCVPDVSANADWSVSPYLMVVDGQPQPNGGTSAASPLCAALIARINAKRPRTKPVGYLTPALYQPVAGDKKKTIGAMGCTDVTSGNNSTASCGGYSAGRGYDAMSGWGTPNGRKLLAALPF
jgi:kumamolisin